MPELVNIAGFACAPYRQHEYEFFRFEPPIEGNVRIPASRNNELAPTVLDTPAYQRMPFQNLDGIFNALDSRERPSRIDLREEFKDPFQIAMCPLRQLERRHTLVRGRLAFFPVARAFR